MGLNSRTAQIVWAIVPVALAGFILELPFVWRALKTKKRSDIIAAAVFGVVQIVVWLLFVVFSEGSGTLREDLPAAVIWIGALSAAVAAAYLYRPLSKEESMDRAQGEQRPGSSYLG
ncbi:MULTISPECIES: hypothetical protein [unclassified Streptomyces]|uniref:hypothetical protein n=1 Tax=unclassified Streptomyces TaxID=2593676 RepID=UPI0022576086|nr:MULTISPECIES: hypothetical protein [unclassified Streptomyces]MCX5443741.1 hypothetical protein [Streptomyces sp. NBC_00063]WUB90918.1 hypothetical protein OHO83_00440 [Streptomyces sp. NBC_00569]WUB99121.1 hypothetical protein OHO83_46450 [Streptomyces sp. NBC_00569]